MSAQQEDDEIVVMHFWDAQSCNRDVVVNFTLRFDDVLDSVKLQSSLHRLTQLGQWRKIGARIRLCTDTGKLELHIPRHYTEQRPAFLYLHTRFQQSILDHPLASQLPRTVSHAAEVFGSPGDLADLVCHPERGQALADWLESDRPQLAIRQVDFEDASLVTLSWSHTFLDAIGQKELMLAWLAVLDGREHEVLPLCGFDQDPLVQLCGRSPMEKHELYDRLLDKKQLMGFAQRMQQDMAPPRRAVQRIISIPDLAIQALKRQVQKTVDESPTGENKNPAHALSVNDVLLAWIARLMASVHDWANDRTVNLMNAFNFRGVVNDQLPHNSAFLGNAVAASQTFVTVRQLREQPIAETALQIRSSLQAQRTSEQIEALLETHQHYASTGKGAVMFGTEDMIVVPWTNWHQARYFDLDFSAAVKKAGQSSDRSGTAVGRPSFVSAFGHGAPRISNQGAVLGRDGVGNWWLQLTMDAEAWVAAEHSLKSMTI